MERKFGYITLILSSPLFILKMMINKHSRILFFYLFLFFSCNDYNNDNRSFKPVVVNPSEGRSEPLYHQPEGTGTYYGDPIVHGLPEPDDTKQKINWKEVDQYPIGWNIMERKFGYLSAPQNGEIDLDGIWETWRDNSNLEIGLYINGKLISTMRQNELERVTPNKFDLAYRIHQERIPVKTGDTILLKNINSTRTGFLRDLTVYSIPEG